MLGSIIGGVIIFGAGVVFVASKKPDDFVMARSIVVSAPASKIFPHVNNLRNWDAWSPWAKLDPNAKNSFEGVDAGVGAKMSWEGNCKVGSGSMTIAESRENEFIRFILDFLKPMKQTSAAEFTFSSEAGGTRVEWKMIGKMKLMNKVMHLIMNCEDMVGKQFDKGLASLKEISEK